MKLSLTICSLLIVADSYAATWIAPTCNYVDVTNTIAKASYGDLVVLPVGTGKWINTVNISGITLAGQGTNSTIIADETPVQGYGYGRGISILSILSTNAGVSRVTGIQFISGVTNNLTSFPGNYGGEIFVSGNCPKWQVDNCMFVQMSGKDVYVADDSFGIVSTCSFFTQSKIALQVFGSGYGDVDWAAPTTLGSTNSVFFENNFCHDNYAFGWVDVSQGGRLTYRDNYVEGCYISTHGAETSGRYRSSRWIEVYGNLMTNTGPQNTYVNQSTAIDFRGGTGVIFSNTMYGYYYGVDIYYYRSDDNNPGFAPWYGLTGLSGWDNNGSAIISGTAVAPSGNCLTPGFTMTRNAYVGDSVYNSNSNLCGIVYSNDLNNMYFTTARDAQYQIGFAAGDHYVLHKPYPCVDQPGVGQCTLLTNLFSPTPVYLNFYTNPVCGWSNTLYTYRSAPTLNNASPVSPYPNIVGGRDFTNTPLAGYTPLVYPHPSFIPGNPLTPNIVTPNNVGFVGSMGAISNMH